MSRASHCLELLRDANLAQRTGLADVAERRRAQLDFEDRRNGFVRRPNSEPARNPGQDYGYRRARSLR